MAIPVKIHQQAHKEYISAYEWYENEQEGLGHKFMNAVEARLLQICKDPQYHSKANKTHRQAMVVGFPYAIVYRFFPKRQLVHISSIHHTSRNPKTKFRKEE